MYYPPPPLVTTTNPLPTGTTGRAYHFALTAVSGTPPYTWTIREGGLPLGLAMSTAGVISGTPAEATNATFTVRVAGTNAAFATTNFSITIYDPPVITTGSVLPEGTTGAPYSVALTGAGGLLPYRWELSSGSLPAGLSLGCITHLPQVAAPADAHYVVTKEVTGGRTISQIEQLDKKSRVAELTRMLGGGGDAVRKHAEALLK